MLLSDFSDNCLFSLIFGFHRAAGLIHPVGEGGLYALTNPVSNTFFLFFQKNRFCPSVALSPKPDPKRLSRP